MIFFYSNVEIRDYQDTMKIGDNLFLEFSMTLITPGQPVNYHNIMKRFTFSSLHDVPFNFVFGTRPDEDYHLDIHHLRL